MGSDVSHLFCLFVLSSADHSIADHVLYVYSQQWILLLGFLHLRRYVVYTCLKPQAPGIDGPVHIAGDCQAKFVFSMSLLSSALCLYMCMFSA